VASRVTKLHHPTPVSKAWCDGGQRKLQTAIAIIILSFVLPLSTALAQSADPQTNLYEASAPVTKGPDCCFITKINLSNRDSYPVLFRVNDQRESEWVMPGKSVALSGDFGEHLKVTSLLTDKLDSQGLPLDGLFHEASLGCKEIISGASPNASFSVASAVWKNCPTEMPVTMPAAAQVPPAPPLGPTPEAQPPAPAPPEAAAPPGSAPSPEAAPTPEVASIEPQEQPTHTRTRHKRRRASATPSRKPRHVASTVPVYTLPPSLPPSSSVGPYYEPPAPVYNPPPTAASAPPPPDIDWVGVGKAIGAIGAAIGNSSGGSSGGGSYSAPSGGGYYPSPGVCH
jgi:hypothetical protein